MPVTPLISVRISWLVVARTSPLAWAAASAARFCVQEPGHAGLLGGHVARERDQADDGAGRAADRDPRRQADAAAGADGLLAHGRLAGSHHGVGRAPLGLREPVGRGARRRGSEGRRRTGSERRPGPSGRRRRRRRAGRRGWCWSVRRRSSMASAWASRASRSVTANRGSLPPRMGRTVSATGTSLPSAWTRPAGLGLGRLGLPGRRASGRGGSGTSRGRSGRKRSVAQRLPTRLSGGQPERVARRRG